MLVPIIVLVAAFFVLYRCAHFVVDGAIEIARVTRTPKFVVGVIVVGFATTAPELAVSVMASFLGHSAIALGNAVGSVICDDALALALGALVAPVALTITPQMLGSIAGFVIGIDLLAYALILNGYMGRIEGALLLGILFGYYAIQYRRESRRRGMAEERPREEGKGMGRALLILILGIAGVVAASRGVVWGAVEITSALGVSSAVIGLTVVAVGTSLPEISTCIAAGLRGEGEIAIGDILGADILNILWIIGMSSLVNPIVVRKSIINFAFPWMIGIVAVTLLFLRTGYRLGKVKGGVLLALYLTYIVWTLAKFY